MAHCAPAGQRLQGCEKVASSSENCSLGQMQSRWRVEPSCSVMRPVGQATHCARPVTLA